MSALGTERATTRRATQTPRAADLAWAAGFLEGEGVFHHSGGSAMVSASQTDAPEVLVRLGALFGGSFSTRTKRVNRRLGINSRDQLVWYACGARARGIMLTLYTYLSPRRRAQVRRALKG